MTSTNAKRAATEALRRHARASLNRDRTPPVTETPSVTSPPVLETKSSSGEIPHTSQESQDSSDQHPSDRPVQTADGSWSYRGETYARGRDTWATFPPRKKPVQRARPHWSTWLTVTAADGSPWAPAAPKPQKGLPRERPPWRTWLELRHEDGRLWGMPPVLARTASQVDGRSWLDVRHADGRPWGTPVLNSTKIGRWLLKISHELAVEAGVTVEESAMFVEAIGD